MAALLGAATGILLSGCPSPCVEAVYSFKATAEFTPGQDSIPLGDTLFLVSVIPKRLQDSQTGKQVDYTNAISIGNTLGIGQLFKNSNIPFDAVNQFDYYNFKGQIFNERNIPSPDGVQQLRYQKTNAGYELRVAIIPKNKGVYVFGIGNGLSTGGSKSKCEKASFETSVTNFDKHWYLFENTLNIKPTADGAQRGYCFTVY